MLHRLAALAARRSAPRQSGAVQKRFASGPTYDPPTGRLFGEPNLPAGEKRTKAGWEDIWYYGFGGSCLLAIIVAAYRPDDTITTWALTEARTRLEAAGTLPKYERKD